MPTILDLEKNSLSLAMITRYVLAGMNSRRTRSNCSAEEGTTQYKRKSFFTMQTLKLPLPCKKVFLSQLRNKNLRTANSFFAQSNCNEKYGIRMESGQLFCFTNVWVQGQIVELNNVDGKAVLQIEDGTGISNIIGLEKIMARNIFLQKEFTKGSFMACIMQRVKEMQSKERQSKH